VRRPCTTQDSGRETRDRGSASSRRAATSQRMLEAITSNLGLQSSANSFRVWARRAQRRSSPALTTNAHTGAPSTGASIAMDGGVTDTRSTSLFLSSCIPTCCMPG